MFKLGESLHISSSRNLILRAEVTPPLGAVVLTEDAKEVGRVIDVFGPKKAPFVSVRSSFETSFLRTLVGRVLFYEERRGIGREHAYTEPRSVRGKRGG